ncbi:FCD domain-containing protein [Desulfovibrio sp. OttesenSCG-928-G15]|nr:FCD domain-containing protein [Desulfovibrio sp. OttesenSCG-928-G15]
MLRPVTKATLHDNILAQLVLAIKEGVWKPGDKLPGEQELARQFQVSRNSIREVLKALVISGVLEASAGQGTFLTADALQKLEGGGLASSIWGDASLWDMKEVRQLLESHIAYLAAKRATAEQVDELERALKQSEAGESLTETHARFHRILSTMAGNPLLTNLLQSVRTKMNELRKRYSTMPQSKMDNFGKEHEHIYHMVRERRAEEARAAMLTHIDDAWMDSLYEGLKGGGAEGIQEGAPASVVKRTIRRTRKDSVE